MKKAKPLIRVISALIAICASTVLADSSRAEDRGFQVAHDVGDGYLAMRSGPGMGHDLVAKIPADATGVLSGECRSPDDNKTKKPWCPATWNGASGWISTCCILEPPKGNAESSPAAQVSHIPRQRIIVDRAYFYADWSSPKPQKTYVINGDVVDVIGSHGDWLSVAYLTSSNKTISGWIYSTNAEPIDDASAAKGSDVKMAIQSSEVPKSVVNSKFQSVQASPSALAAKGSGVGPSYDCAKIQTPLAQMICSSSALSKVDLEMAQSFNALRQQVEKDGWLTLVREAVAFQNFVQNQCNIPTFGSPPPGDSAQATCLEQAYRKQRTEWVSRLQWPAIEEAQRSIEEHIALQSDLKKLGFLSAEDPVDGVYGGATRAAITSWQVQRGFRATGFLISDQAYALERATTDSDQNASDQSQQLQNQDSGAQKTANAAPVGALIDECDRLAGRPGDVDLPVGAVGVSFNDIKAGIAVAACLKATSSYPQERRFIFELGRAYVASGQYSAGNKKYKEAINLGSAAALTGFGSDYDEGLGFEINYDTALVYYKRAAAMNDPAGINNLARAYLEGRGTPIDQDKAIELYAESALLGERIAMTAIGNMYRDGDALPLDTSKSLVWYDIAAKAAKHK